VSSFSLLLTVGWSRFSRFYSAAIRIESRRLALSNVILLHCASGTSFSDGRLLLKRNYYGGLVKRSIQRALVCEVSCITGMLRAGRESSSWWIGLQRLGVNNTSATPATACIRISSREMIWRGGGGVRDSWGRRMEHSASAAAPLATHSLMQPRHNFIGRKELTMRSRNGHLGWRYQRQKAQKRGSSYITGYVNNGFPSWTLYNREFGISYLLSCECLAPRQLGGIYISEAEKHKQTRMRAEGCLRSP